MVLDKIKYINKINLFVILIWISYLFTYFSNLTFLLPTTEYSEAWKKRNLTIQKGILLIGGSNVRMGLSAEIVCNNPNKCINFGISGELGGFSRYINFIEDRVFPEIIVYSTADIWSDVTLNDNIFLNSMIISNISIYEQIKTLFLPYPTLYFNTYGDQVNYNCDTDTDISSHLFNEKNFTLSNEINAKVLFNRVENLKKIFGSKKVILRVPPIYTSSDKIKLINDAMLQRIKALKELGIIVVDGTLASSDKSLFCYNDHPNNNGRYFFSLELKDFISKIKLVN